MSGGSASPAETQSLSSEVSGAAALQEHCKSRLAVYKYPRAIEFRTDLPKTATGKIQRFKLRAESPTGTRI